MRIEFLEEAQVELDEAVEYYDNEVEGLGETFFQEVLYAIDRIARYPDAWHPLSEKHAKMPNQTISLRANLYNTRRYCSYHFSIKFAQKAKSLERTSKINLTKSSSRYFSAA